MPSVDTALRVEEGCAEWHYPTILAWSSHGRSRTADDFTPKTLPEFTAVAASARQWTVFCGAAVVGYLRFKSTTLMAGWLSFTFDREFWRSHSDCAEAAVRAVCRLLFSEGLSKVTVYTIEDDADAMIAAARIGGELEGTLREHVTCRGRLVDLFVIGILMREFIDDGGMLAVQPGPMSTNECGMQTVRVN